MCSVWVGVVCNVWDSEMEGVASSREVGSSVWCNVVVAWQKV